MDKPQSRYSLGTELTDERQRSARLREAIQEALYAVVATVEFYENATPRMAGEVPLGAAKAILMRVLAGGEEAPTYYRALVWDETGTTYRVGEGRPRPVTAWNVRLWFEDGDSTHFHTDAPKRRRQP